MKNCNCQYKNSCMIPDEYGCGENTYNPDYINLDDKTKKLLNEILKEKNDRIQILESEKEWCIKFLDSIVDKIDDYDINGIYIYIHEFLHQFKEV